MTRLHLLAQQAIDASAALTSASIAGPVISDSRYAELDRLAEQARILLLDCLAREHGIDGEMAAGVGALLF